MNLKTCKNMKTATSKKANPVTITKANNPQLPVSPALQFVSLELIETAPQIRKNFHQESIEELAADIKTRGMLQPVLLRPLPDGKFLMIAGERRLRAARFAELDNIPALIGEVNDQAAGLMQLAENIHREDLDLDEECQAIKILYESLGSLDKVADMVKKSKPWCSKRYAMTQEDMHFMAKRLLEEGITEDVELLNAYSNLCEIASWSEINEWLAKIQKGEAGRNEIRAALKKAKEQLKKEKQGSGLEKVSHAKPRTPPPPPVWKLDEALDKLSEALIYADADLNAKDLMDSYTADQRKKIIQKLIDAWSVGSAKDGFKTISQLIMHGLYSSDYNEVELSAMIMGYGGEELHWEAFLEQLQTPREE